MKFNHYVMPSYVELRAEGYLPEYISKPVQDAVFRGLTMIGSPFAKYAQWYMSKYGNVLELGRIALTTYAYGIANLQQFGEEEKEVAYHCIKRCTVKVMGRYVGLSGMEKPKYYIRYNRKFIESFISIIIDALDSEARDHIKRMSGAVVPYWFEKKPKRKPKLHLGHGKGGQYRIEKYADMFD